MRTQLPTRTKLIGKMRSTSIWHRIWCGVCRGLPKYAKHVQHCGEYRCWYFQRCPRFKTLDCPGSIAICLICKGHFRPHKGFAGDGYRNLHVGLHRLWHAFDYEDMYEQTC